MRGCMVLALAAGLLGGLSGQTRDLAVTVQDLRIEQSLEGGYYLYVRQKPDIKSVLLVESTRDPTGKLDNYAYRNPVWHAENGDEKRILDGKFLNSKDNWALIDSTPVDDKAFGKAFRIFIPWVLVYGYPYTRFGQIQVLDGTYLSVRAFEKPYADYAGAFADNPFEIKVTQKPLAGPPEGNFMAETVKTYKDIAEKTKGELWYSKGEEDILKTLDKILAEQSGRDLELVLVLDATNSMQNDAPFVRNGVMPLIQSHVARHSHVSMGIVQYRDYLEEFLYKTQPFTSDLAVIQRALDRYQPAGGRDIPEAVNEALYAALGEYLWGADSRIIVLVGDAPPHPMPRGSVTASMVENKAKELGVTIHSIILPQ